MLNPVATAVPPHVLSQAELMEVAAAVGPAGLVSMFQNARVERRALAMPVDWYLQPHGFAARNAAYADVGLPLIHEAASQAIDAAGLRATDVDSITFVSTTGIATPSLDARLATRLGCRPDVVRLPVWGLGCAGGVAGLNLAAQLARAAPASHHLVVCLELCSLSFDAGQMGLSEGHSKKTMAAASLFGDGCAAIVVSGDATGAHGPRHARGARHLFPGTERVMGWDVHDDHLEVVLSPRIPDIVREHMRGLVDGMAGAQPVDHWVLHPGGARVIDAYEDALGLAPDALTDTKQVLADHGNMSSPTVLFVLRQKMAQGIGPGQSALLAALGPGFASDMAWVEGA